MKLKPTIGFFVALLLCNALVFTIHIVVLSALELNVWDNLLVAAYLINGVLALAIGFGLFALRYKYTESLGFIFLGGTGLKFLIFFLVFSPYYKEDSEIQRIEFITFFIPYTINLIVETAFLVRVLNRMTEKG